ncbi:MAG: HlyD family secretion protein [Parvibaculum sp.]|nr:HlyD family secretion protein [Parvibaculum sp.]
MNAIDVTADVLPRASGGLQAKLKALPARALIVAGTAALVITLGATWIALPASSVSTDDAYLKADNTIVAPKVHGLIAQVLVRENEHVNAGDVLVRIDGDEYTQAVNVARAELTSAEALLAQQSAQEQYAAANVVASATAIRAADAERERARADAMRYNALVGQGHIAQRDAERVRATAIAASASAEKSRADLTASESQAVVVSHTRARLEADVAKAKAALAIAELDLDHATVRAPVAGIVGDRAAQVGAYVQPGTSLMRIVPMETIYVTANFKETQIARMNAGQPARVKVDAVPGETFAGEVESFSPASGSEFALLPFEPATGNFTRIVQRLPVRIRILPNQPHAERLRPGLSATVKVDLSGS